MTSVNKHNTIHLYTKNINRYKTYIIIVAIFMYIHLAPVMFIHISAVIHSIPCVNNHLRPHTRQDAKQPWHIHASESVIFLGKLFNPIYHSNVIYAIYFSLSYHKQTFDPPASIPIMLLCNQKRNTAIRVWIKHKHGIFCLPVNVTY